VERAQDGSDMTRLRSFNDSTSKRVLDLLETEYLRVRELTLQRITVIRLEVNDRGCNVTGS